MQVVNIPTAMGLIAHVAVKKRRVLYIWGSMGLGKSEIVAQAAAAEGATLIDIRTSQYESIDFRGIPDIQQNLTVWNMPATLPFKGNPKFDEDGPPIFLFLDEVNQGDPSVMSVLYQLLNDRRIGEHQLMSNVVIICAGNRDQDRGVTNKFPDPLANRGTHCELIADVKPWSVWAAKAGVSPTMIGFLNFRSELLHTHDPNKPVKAFATPRSWKFANEDFVDPDMPADVKQAALSGSVGEGPAIELQAFAEIMDSLKPIEEIIKDPTGVEVPTKLDMQWAMATHIAGHMDKSNATALHTYLSRLEPEMVVMAWTLAINRDEDITDTDAFLNGYAPAYRGLFQS